MEQIGKLDDMNDVIKMLESQGYREGGVMHFEGGGRPSDNTNNIAPLEEKTPVDEKPFVEPDWVSKAPSVIGTAVEPVYPMIKVHDGNLTEDTSKPPIGYRYDNGKAEYQYLDLSGKPTKIENRGHGLVNQIGTMAKDMSPIIMAALSGGALGPELTPWLQGLKGASSLSQGDVLGGLANMAGAGGYSDIGKYLSAGKALQSGDPLAMLGSAAGLTGNADLQEISKGAKALSGISKGNIGSILGAAGDYSGNQDIKDVLPYLQAATKVASASKNPQAAISALLASGSQKPVDIASLFPRGITAEPNPS